jgi:hypothetical protein
VISLIAAEEVDAETQEGRDGEQGDQFDTSTATSQAVGRPFVLHCRH